MRLKHIQGGFYLKILGQFLQKTKDVTHCSIVKLNPIKLRVNDLVQKLNSKFYIFEPN